MEKADKTFQLTESLLVLSGLPRTRHHVTECIGADASDKATLCDNPQNEEDGKH